MKFFRMIKMDFKRMFLSGKFYFANAATVAKGEVDFRRIWGQRDLADNWRYSSKSASIEDLKNEALGKLS